MEKYDLELGRKSALEGVYAMISKFGIMLCMCVCCGCYTLPLWTPSCSHTDRPVFEFNNFDDGHHFVFRENSKLAASVNVKAGYLQGNFEVYYNTGILKYWGKLDSRGHIVSGKYNTDESSPDDWDIRGMTVADKQNAQLELYDLIQNGIRKMDATQIKTDMAKGGNEMTESLFNCSKSTFHPLVGNIYQHDGKGLKIFQSIDGAVLVNVDVSASRSIFDYLNMRIDTKVPYVDGEFLKPGRYEFIGPYTYETIKKQTRTIRRFKQVD